MKILLIGLNRSWITSLEINKSLSLWIHDTHDNWKDRSTWVANSKILSGKSEGDLFLSKNSDHLLDLVKEINFDAIIPGVDHAVQFATYLSELSSLKSIGSFAAEHLTNKVKLRNLFYNNYIIHQPEWNILNIEELNSLAQTNFPFVLKPSNLQASSGVSIVQDASDLEGAVQRLRVAIESSATNSQTEVLVEDFMNGPEYSTEILVSDGKIDWVNVTRKYIADGPSPVEIGHMVPGTYDKDLLFRFKQVSEELVSTLNADTGILHAEWILINSQPHLVECAGRVPGDYILTLAKDAWGFNPYLALLDILTGSTPIIPQAPAQGAAISYLVGKPGIVNNIILPQSVIGPNVQEINLFVDKGDTILSLECSWDRCGYIRTTSHDSLSAFELSETVRKQIVIELD